MIQFIGVILGHFIGDLAFLGFLGNAKRESLFYLALHCIIYAIMVCVTILLLNRKRYAHWKFFVLFGTHFFIDYYKCYITGINVVKYSLTYNIVDQMLHLLVLAIVFSIKIRTKHPMSQGRE